MKVTLKDIAEETGYSISTVSRVLNGSGKMSTKARRQIVQSAKKLNYPIYHTANGDSAVDLIQVCLVVSGHHVGEFYASFFHGINRAAEENNVMLSLISINRPFSKLVGTLKRLASNSYDGIILFTPELTRNDYETIREKLPDGYPVISNGLIENPVFTTITFDGYSGGFLAGEHFKRRGYTTCGIIRGPFEKAESRYRANGFRDFIQQSAGMKVVWDYHGDFTFESGLKAYDSFEELEHQPRAIFACNDVMCHGFMEAALVNGHSFPEDIAIIGYDDLPICRRHRPTISSVHTSYEQLGTVTVQTLHEIITDPGQQKGVLSLVPVELNVRESS